MDTLKEIDVFPHIKWFWNYVLKFDITNHHIYRKIDHSFAVAEKCFEIASKQDFSLVQCQFCYLMGLFHDLGRFTQWQKYQTFSAALSTDHGDLSSEIIKQNNCFGFSGKPALVLCEAVKYHTKHYMGQDEDVKKYNNILNNADVFCNITNMALGAKNVLYDEIDKTGVSNEILQAFKERRLLNDYKINTKLDCMLLNSAALYCVTIPYLRQEILSLKVFEAFLQNFIPQLNSEDGNLLLELLKELKTNYK